MVVILTSPVMGKNVGDQFTGPEESFLIAEGYAKNATTLDPATPGADKAYAASFTVDPDNDNQVDYTGTLKGDGENHLTAGGVATDILPADDPTLAANREDEQQWPNYVAPDDGFANDVAHLAPASGGTNTGSADGSTNAERTADADNDEVDYDFDEGGVNDDVPTIDTLEPATGAASGGTVVTVTGTGFEGVTGVTFGGTAGTALDVVSDTELTVTTPVHAAGAVDVVVTNPNGSATETSGFTYTA